jgi:hypothetical protein
MRRLIWIIAAVTAGSAGVAVAQEVQVFEGKFQPASTTARAYTGAITFTRDGLEGALGQKYGTTSFGHIEASVATGRGGPTFADLLGVDDKASITIRKVRTQIIPPSARNGGFCDNDPTSFLAMVQVGEELRMAAFKGKLIGGGADPKDLCGTYNYAR